MSFHVHCGDALTVLRTMPDESVDCCITSPPYFGLRDYGIGGQIGLEKTPEEYVSRLVDVFRDVRRVLKNDGVLWLNLGDSYAGGKTGRADHGSGDTTSKLGPKRDGLPGGSVMGRVSPRPVPAGFKPKDLIGIPWMVAFALRSDGWYLRSDIIWSKPNPMPESVTDRPTKAHEYLFLLAKSERYYYDSDAIREPLSEGSAARYGYAFGGAKSEHTRSGLGTRTHVLGNREVPTSRNRRTVWTVPSCPTPEAHFATYPLELIEPCILAGCPFDGTVLDPFSGAGTTGLAALKHGRNYIGIELNPEYVEMSYRRAEKHCPLLMIG
jgi:DNA modification methylase